MIFALLYFYRLELEKVDGFRLFVCLVLLFSGVDVHWFYGFGVNFRLFLPLGHSYPLRPLWSLRFAS